MGPSGGELAGEIRLASSTGRWLLAGTVLGSAMATLDATVVNVALPRLGTSLHAGFAGLQWVLNGYLLSLASLILIGGALGDRYGRRSVFTVGVVVFAGASLACGLAPDIDVLIVARVVQGIGGALLTPGSLAIIQASFHPDDRARAIGAWSGLGGITTAVGPFVGGWLVESASWRWIFLLNLPMAVLVVWVARAHMPESRDPTATGRLDVTGALLGALGLAALTDGLIERSLLVGAIGVVAMVGFVGAERVGRAPILPLSIFRSRQFSAANAVTFLVYAALSMVLFVVSVTLQMSLRYTPIAAGAAAIPITLIMLAFSARAGALAQRIGPRIPMTVGPLIIGTGQLLMVRIEPGRGYWVSGFPAFVLFGAGLAFTVAPLTATVLAAADARHSGIASGVNNAVSRVGGLLAVAAVPLIAGFDPARAVDPSRLLSGFHVVAATGAAITMAGGVLAWLTIRSSVLTGDVPPAADRELDANFHCPLDAAPLHP